MRKSHLQAMAPEDSCHVSFIVGALMGAGGGGGGEGMNALIIIFSRYLIA